MTPATSFLSETGTLCRACFARWEAEDQATRSAARARDAVALRQAGRLGQFHGVNWSAGVILLAGWVAVPGWLSTALVAGIIVLAIAMRFRSRAAFRVAMAVDTAGSIVFLAVSATHVAGGRLLFLLFPAVFGWWLAFLTWRRRGAFA